MKRQRYNFVMAIYPNTRGFAFVLFESLLSPIDWQVVEIRGKEKNRKCVSAISKLFGNYEPDVLILQEMKEHGGHRASRIRQLNEAIEVLAGTQGIPVVTYSRDQVRAHFGEVGETTKRVIAESIAKRIPLFERFLPPVRKIWMSEHPRSGLFDAIALVISWYRSHELA